MPVPNTLGEESVDFTLKYAGLVMTGPSTVAKLSRTNLREAFHKQLAILWRVHPYLKDLDPGTFPRQRQRTQRLDEVAPKVHYGLWYRCLEGGYDYVPIVHYGHRAHCHLAIRVHSLRAPGGIIHSGADLDNRLGVVIDALKMPDPTGPYDESNSTGEEPMMFCLLENDDLVTKISIESFRLLSDDPEAAKPEYIDLDIDVHIVPAAATPFQLSALVAVRL
jgi:hypothetical protein